MGSAEVEASLMNPVSHAEHLPFSEEAPLLTHDAQSAGHTTTEQQLHSNCLSIDKVSTRIFYNIIIVESEHAREKGPHENV